MSRGIVEFSGEINFINSIEATRYFVGGRLRRPENLNFIPPRDSSLRSRMTRGDGFVSKFFKN